MILGDICYLGLRNILQKFGNFFFHVPLLTYLSEIVQRLYHLSVVLSMLFQMIGLWSLYDINFGRRTLYKVEKTTIFDIVVRCHFTNLITSSLLHLQCCSWYHTMHHHHLYPYICISIYITTVEGVILPPKHAVPRSCSTLLNSRRTIVFYIPCLLYTSPSPRDGLLSRMPSSA